jgi:hypothetical protein
MMKENPSTDPPSRALLTPAELHAWWIELDGWVGRLRDSHEHLWPPPATSIKDKDLGKVRQLPWPECWPRHAGLVEFLNGLFSWHSILLKLAFTEQAARSWVDWHTIVEQTLAKEIQVIAKYCRNGHRGPDVAQPEPGADITGKTDVTWSDYFGRDASKPKTHHAKRRDHPSSEGLA